MSEELEGLPQSEAAPEAAPVEAPETPVEATEAPAETPEATPEAPKPAAPSKALMGRISKLTAEKAAREARIAELEALVARQTAPQAEGAPQGHVPSPQDFQAEVAKAARLQAEQARFAERCNEIYNGAKAKHADFDARIADVNQLGGFTMPMVEAAMELDNPSDVLYALTGDLDKFAEISGMSPTKQAIALAKFARTLETPAPKKSSAPPPVAPKVGGGRVPAQVNVYDDNISMEDFMRQRDAQIKEARKKGVRIY